MKFKKYILLLLMLSSLIIFQAPNKANAAIYGGRWYKDIKIYVPTSNSEVAGSFGIAISSWNKALSEVGANIRILTVYSPSEANVTVTTVDSLGGAIGSAQLYPSQTSSSYTSGLIKINTNQFDYLVPAKQTTAATHELGHILGLAHSPDGSNSVMTELVNALIFPTSYDKGELSKIY